MSIVDLALTDALAGWRYIRATHGDLYGVGWDRVETRLAQAIKARSGETEGLDPKDESAVPEGMRP